MIIGQVVENVISYFVVHELFTWLAYSLLPFVKFVLKLEFPADGSPIAVGGLFKASDLRKGGAGIRNPGKAHQGSGRDERERV